LKQNLAKSQLGNRSTPQNLTDPANIVITALDLLILLLPHLAPSGASALFQFTLSSNALTYDDNGVQKRAYKVLGKLIECGKVTVNVEEVLKTMDEVVENLSTPAMKVLHTLHTLTQFI
jgi:ribosomal RNA-processing protein 12